MGHHAFELTLIEQLQDAGGGGNVRLVGSTTCCKGVRCWVFDDVDIGRLREASGDRRVFDGAKQLGGIFLRDLAGTTCRRHDRASSDVAEDAVADRDHAHDQAVARPERNIDCRHDHGHQHDEQDDHQQCPHPRGSDLLLERH